MSHDPAMPRFRSMSGVTGPAGALGSRIHGARHPSGGGSSSAGRRPRDERLADEAPAAGRRWTVRRALAALLTPLLLCAALLGGHSGWTAFAERRLRGYADELRGAGEPIWLSQINPAPVADHDNAALELCVAARAINASHPAWRPYFLQGPPRLPMTVEQREVIRAVLNVNRDALAHVTVARDKPGTDWTPIAHAESNDAPFHVLRGQGVYRVDTLMNLLYAAALVAHADGDEAAALSRVEEMLFVSRAVSERRTLNAYSYSLGREETAMLAIGQLLPELRIGPGPGAVPAGRVADLVHRLLDARPYVEAMTRNARAERARQIESFMPPPGHDRPDYGVADPWGPQPSSAMLKRSYKYLLLRPARLTAEHQAFQDLQRSLVALGRDDPAQLLAGFAEHPQSGGTGHDGAFVRAVTASMYSVAHTHTRAMARRHAMGAGLACALYRADRGAWPEPGLDALVPDFLERVPADPLVPGGGRLTYVAGLGRPRIYSVGADGTDEGGACLSILATEGSGPRATDIVVDLERQALPPIVYNSMLEEDEETAATD